MTGPASNPSPFWQLRRRVKKSIQLWNGPALSGPGANQKRANWSSGSEKAVCQHDPKTWRAWIVIGTLIYAVLCLGLTPYIPYTFHQYQSLSTWNVKIPGVLKHGWTDWTENSRDRSWHPNHSIAKQVFNSWRPYCHINFLRTASFGKKSMRARHIMVTSTLLGS